MRETAGDDGVGSSYIDVTVPVQALVSDSKLVIPGGRAKYNLIGFWDPCIAEPKKLRVRYLFRDVLHEVTVDDMAALRIPVKRESIFVKGRLEVESASPLTTVHALDQ